MNVLYLKLTICLLLLVSPTYAKTYTVFGKAYTELESAEHFSEEGMASWYGEQFHGNVTASGEVYDMNKISLAHKTLPLGTWVEVTNLENNRKIIARVNDRGPFAKERIADLSFAAARKLLMLKNGTAKIRIRVVKSPNIIKKAISADPHNHPSEQPITLQLGTFRQIENVTHLRNSLQNLTKSLTKSRWYILKYGPSFRLIVMSPTDEINSLKNILKSNNMAFIQLKASV